MPLWVRHAAARLAHVSHRRYKVPQGCVLVYYDGCTVDADRCLGFIDMRKCEGVRRSRKTVNKKERTVLELITKGRTFNLAPDTVNESLTANPSPSLQYILGWPVPEPSFGKELTVADEGGDAGAEEAVAAKWFDTLAVLQEAEGRCQHFLVKVMPDSTETLPPSIVLRVAATELALLDVGDRDLAHTCWSYKDIISHSNPSQRQLHFTVRVPGAMVRAVLETDKAADIKAAIDSNIGALLGPRHSKADAASKAAAAASGGAAAS